MEEIKVIHEKDLLVTPLLLELLKGFKTVGLRREFIRDYYEKIGYKVICDENSVNIKDVATEEFIEKALKDYPILKVLTRGIDKSSIEIIVKNYLRNENHKKTRKGILFF